VSAAGASLIAIAFDLKPAQPAINAPDRRRRPRWLDITLHLERPGFEFDRHDALVQPGSSGFYSAAFDLGRPSLGRGGFTLTDVRGLTAN
jgi:hypothetical protein